MAAFCKFIPRGGSQLCQLGGSCRDSGIGSGREAIGESEDLA
jgi:hypothetical protein